MTIATTRHPLAFDTSGYIGSYVDDPESGLRASLLSPKQHPVEWATYLDQAEESYGTHGVEAAVRRAQLEVEPCPAFWHIADPRTGQVAGGMRCHGPYPSTAEAWGLQEFEGFDVYPEVAAIIEPLIPNGVIENKGAYMAVDAKAAHDVPAMFVRCMSLSIEVVGAKTLMGTSARHTLPLWQFGGCVIPRPDLKVPYPDERYETVLVVHETKRRQELMARSIRIQRIRDIAAFKGEEIEVGYL